MRYFLSAIVLLTLGSVRAQTYTVASPDETMAATIVVKDNISYSISLDHSELVHPSAIGLDVEGITGSWKVKKTERHSADQQIIPVVKEKFATIRDHYNELVIHFRNSLALSFRVYDNGVAYRWQLEKPGEWKIKQETAAFSLDPADTVYYPLEQSFYSHNERTYPRYAIKDINDKMLASLPTLIDHHGTKLLIEEADLYDYAGMWLLGDGGTGLKATFPDYPASEKQTDPYNRRVLQREDYIAQTQGARTLPWRVLAIARHDGDLITNQLVYQLSRATTEDFSWVKPGKVSWDWWNALNIYGVDFKSGVNTDTYKYYIDFAAKYGLDYIILDEGWSKQTDITSVVPAVNMEALTAYARQKKVGLILWVLWTALDKQMDEALDLYAKWGIKGIKVDFMQRDDEEMVNFYERAARATAKRHMLIDFHGAFKPTGLRRLFPNALTREGVYGMEQSKWDTSMKVGPDHTVMLPFTRMVPGPMDFTPGAMQNAQKRNWRAIWERPMSLGTRCHQLAMYVVFESPLQMLADNPSNYYREPECMEWLRAVPVEWNDTKVLAAKVGDYIALARQSAAGDWYLGAMTNWSARDLTLDLSFLGDGDYEATIWRDGINADRVAIDYKKLTQTVNKNSKLTIHLAPGGGWVARIRKK